jgi:hypothetical protein
MSRRRTAILLIVLGGLCAALLAIISGAAKELFRVWIEAQRWYSPTLVWLLLIAVVIAGIAIAVSQYVLAPSAQQAGSSISERQLKRNRRQMIARVRHDWIEGVLNQSLYHVVRIDLGLEDRPDVVDNPLTLVVQEAAKPPRMLPPRTKISTSFDEHAGALLILGAPGSGKTTLLLELACTLLDRADKDETHPMPVVFNLSSWAGRRLPLAEWLIEELNGRYQVPRKLAQEWVPTEQILPLLDGLDEVAAEHREACVGTINKFRAEHGLLPMAVCSRAEEYQTLTSRLRLPTAVVVQPLTRGEVEEYLDRYSKHLAGIRAALAGDETLWELLDTPLMLSIAMLAYHGVTDDSRTSADGTLENRRRDLFARYVDTMFGRRTKETRYTREQTLQWLGWLASSMTRLGQSDFQLVSLSYRDWLRTRREQAWLRWGIGLVGGLIYGLVLGPYFCLLAGLIGGLIYGRVYALIYGLVGGLIYGRVFGKPFGMRDLDVLRWSWTLSRLVLRMGLVLGLVPVLAAGLIYGGLVYGLAVGLALGMIGGLIVATDLRALEFLQQWSMRVLLWRYGYAPFLYVRFLDYAAERIFLRKVGGGYIFVHRMLLEYFASIPRRTITE